MEEEVRDENMTLFDCFVPHPIAHQIECKDITHLVISTELQWLFPYHTIPFHTHELSLKLIYACGVVFGALLG